MVLWRNQPMFVAVYGGCLYESSNFAATGFGSVQDFHIHATYQGLTL